jgi:hypothetical protein
MSKVAGLSVAIALAVVIVTIWVHSVAITKQAEVRTEPMKGISPHELHLKADIKSLPIQDIADPI